jgi:hypothetical protein
MQLMSRKMSASQALEGEFSEDGLAAMAGEDNMQMALAKQLSQRISEADMQRNWGKVASGSKTKKKISSKLDTLSEDQQALVNAATAAQILAETIEEADLKRKTTPAEERACVLRAIGWGMPVPPRLYAEHATGDPQTAAVEELKQVSFFSPPQDGCAESDPATLEWEDAGPEKELDEETGEEFELGFFDINSEPVILKTPEPEDNEPEDEEEDFELPELTPEIMLKMFQNLEQHGLL